MKVVLLNKKVVYLGSQMRIQLLTKTINEFKHIFVCYNPLHESQSVVSVLNLDNGHVHGSFLVTIKTFHRHSLVYSNGTPNT